MDTQATDPVITNAQVSEYRENGFVVVDAVYSDDDVAEMRAELDGLVAGAAGLSDHTELYDLEPTHTPTTPRVRRIKHPFGQVPVFGRMGRHPRLLTVLRRLIGADLRMHGSKINLKSAAYGSPVEWHQDWAFYPHTNDDVLAVGVMLDDMTPDNGPMLMIPGSHTGPTYDHHQDGCFIGAIDVAASGLDVSRAEMVTGRAGSCSFHHVRAVHGSGQNTSGADRRLLLYQVAAADAWDIGGAGAGNWDNYAATIIAGQATNQPRIVPTPVRLPYPPPVKGGSIYETQTLLKKKTFTTE